jgi:hypothetical protein
MRPVCNSCGKAVNTFFLAVIELTRRADTMAALPDMAPCLFGFYFMSVFFP